MKTSTSTRRAVAYIRVSHVGNRKDNLVSDKMQLVEAQRYAKYEGFDFDEVQSKACADLDVSGFRKPWRQRPGLMRLYEAARRREFDVLIFFKISRLARNVREALDMINAFEQEGVAFHFVAEKIDSSSAQGRFLRTVLLAAAEMQSEDIGAFIRSAGECRAKDGRLHGGAVPIWMRRDGEEIQLIPDQVDAIRRIVELRMSGLGYVKIAKKLNGEGRRTANGRYWTHGMTYKYLQPSWIKTMTGTGFFGRDREAAIEIPGIFPRILSDEEAEALLALQLLYSQDYGRKPVSGLDWMISKGRKRGRYSASTVHLLSSLIFCPHCGGRMVASFRGQAENRATPFNYSCPHAVTRGEVHAGQTCSVAANGVEDAVLRVVRQALVMPPASNAKPKPQTEKRSIDKLQGKIDHLVNMHLDGRIEEDDFKRTYSDLIQQKEALQAQLQVSASSQQDFAMRIAEREEPTREELRQLILIMVDRIEAPITLLGHTVREDKSSLRRFARITLKFPTALGNQTFIAGIYRSNFTGERTCIPN